ncbi:pyridoxine 5'-phosphate synthase [Gluconacetobacter azotocaptans]|uniref:Pyridoxine 5'-phosphate synthase n=1 Tax=Gluconacetobacter azotocaptans TaxID=142834 RepID=A0A7W4PCG6_9PROT|nr:pyridoxine 5'-phosphate synthase [Gluconacetobacter azotocaptans]MBB2189237.1 pyridoxine 5'-phosphate synthase [Gluconacetobacter azotocaptans]MBM9402140.1 pyridoxine 5'-phosphate synthase [Gluconacetobacter azotocaptans]GBQ32349.1 pyridoxine 5'-phosphate synthase [Gluconacetobacter azotocaptans DSM 13594]
MTDSTPPKVLRPKMLRLGVNIDHVATVRNARGGAHPDPVEAARLAAACGADGITAHLREDRRHIRDADLARLRADVSAPLNMEMAATDEMVGIALSLRPHACCIVPERRAEVTTEGGLDVAGQVAALEPRVRALGEAGIRVSMFIDPDPAQIAASAAIGAAVVELHTGAYAEGRAGELDRLRAAAIAADAAGLEVHAGHGLTYDNVGPIAALPQIVELNIGHFLIGQAIFDGLPAVIARMRQEMERGRQGLCP